MSPAMLNMIRKRNHFRNLATTLGLELGALTSGRLEKNYSSAAPGNNPGGHIPWPAHLSL